MKFTPLSNNFLLVSLIGLIVVGFLLYSGSLNPTWGFTLLVMFLIFLAASFISLTPEGTK